MKIKMEACLGPHEKEIGRPYRDWEKMELFIKDVKLAEFDCAKLDGGPDIDLGKLNLAQGITEFKMIFTMRREGVV